MLSLSDGAEGRTNVLPSQYDIAHIRIRFTQRWRRETDPPFINITRGGFSV